MNALVVRLGALGDVVHAIPAVAALRKRFPEARIDWLVERKHRELVDLVSAVDRTIVVEAPSLRGWTSAVREMRRTAYDVAIDLQGLMKSAVLARASGARRTVGFSIWHLREKTARPFYSEAVDVGAAHVIRKNLRLLRAFGIDEQEIAFPLATPPSAALDRIRADVGDRRFALVNPGAAWPNKRWPTDRFGEVASFLHDACGVVPIVLWGPGEDGLAREVIAASSGTALLAPPTTITDLVAVTRAAAIVISGDTGPLHIAEATGAPTVALFGPTDPARNGPFAPGDVTVSRHDRCACHYDRRCHNDRWCLDDVTVAEVSAAVQGRLRSILSPRE